LEDTEARARDQTEDTQCSFFPHNLKSLSHLSIPVRSTTVGIANITHHSLQLCGETELISPETAKRAGVDLCHQRLSWQPKNDESTLKVVYVVGTGNEDKLINLEQAGLGIAFQPLRN
jgi:hypothetical protein